MGFFKVSTAAEDVKDSSGNYINTSGVYPVTIKGAAVDTNDKGARSITLLIDYNGQVQPIFGAIKLDNNDGSPNFEAAVFNKLCIVCGIEEVDEPTEATLPLGKGKADKDVMVLSEFEDVEVTLRIQMEYSLYNGEIKDKKRIRNVFRSVDNATADEIVNEAPVGVQYEKELEYADKVTYKDDLTEEDISAWIASRSNKTEKKTTASKIASKAPAFGKPKFGTK